MNYPGFDPQDGETVTTLIPDQFGLVASVVQEGNKSAVEPRVLFVAHYVTTDDEPFRVQMILTVEQAMEVWENIPQAVGRAVDMAQEHNARRN